MPPPEQVRELAAQCLADLRLVRFAAEPTTVLAGGAVTIRWDVDTSACSNPHLASFFLNSSRVQHTGSRELRPNRTVTFTLVARAMGMSQTLGRVQVQVDESSCRPSTIREDEIQPLIVSSIRTSVERYNAAPGTEHKVRFRRDPTAEIESSGIIVGLRLKLEINNFFDPDIDVDARIAVGVSSEGQALPFYNKFAVDVDWPWYVTGLTLGISKIVEEFVDGTVQGAIKQRMLDDFRTGINTSLRLFPGVAREFQTRHDAIIVTMCNP